MSTTMVNTSSFPSVKQMSLRTPMQSLGLNNRRFPSASSILNRYIHKPTSNTSSLSSKPIQNGSMDKPAFINHNPNPAPPTPNLPTWNQSSITSNQPPDSIQNEPMSKKDPFLHAIFHRLKALDSNDPFSPSLYDLFGHKPISAPSNTSIDGVSVPEGWTNASLFLPYICMCFEPEGYGLPPMNPILCDYADTRFLLEVSGDYYLYNHVSDTLYRIDRPTKLSSIVSALGDWKGIKTTEMELL